MQFFKAHGKICLDMRGDLLLHKHKEPITFTTKSAMPHSIGGGSSARVVSGGRIRASITALGFIWSK